MLCGPAGGAGPRRLRRSDRLDGALRQHGADGLFLDDDLGVGGDFDGDKISLASRVELDDDVFKAMRTGRTLLGALDKSGVNVMQRVFEEQEFILLGKAFRSNNAAVLKNAAKVHEDLGTFLRQTLRTPDGPFAEKLVTRFLGAVASGNPKAKTELFDALAREFPAEMREVGEASWRNPWFQINSFVHQRLHFQRQRVCHPRGAGGAHPRDGKAHTAQRRSNCGSAQTRPWPTAPFSACKPLLQLHAGVAPVCRAHR